jgi:hypothetical protein
VLAVQEFGSLRQNQTYLVNYHYFTDCSSMPHVSSKGQATKPAPLKFSYEILNRARFAKKQGGKVYRFGCEDDVYPLLTEEQTSRRCTHSLPNSCVKR